MKALLRFALLACVLASPLRAKDAPPPTPWITPSLDVLLAQVPPAPTAGSPADRADLDYTLAIQADANPDLLRRAEIVALYFNVFSYSQVLGPKFTPDAYPKTHAFFKQLDATTNVSKNLLKDHFARPRPVDAHKGLVKQLVPYEAGYSYPSGHSARAWLDALVLGQLDPGDRLAFLRQAALVGYYRVLGGMHYQSDVIASRTLAEYLFAQLQADPAFTKALADLQAAEWATPPAVDTAK
jgi:acid phosphatase (class A)